MIISEVYKKGKSAGSLIVIDKQVEAQKLIDAMEFYVKAHPKQKIAKSMLKELQEDLQCY